MENRHVLTLRTMVDMAFIQYLFVAYDVRVNAPVDLRD